MATDRNVSTGMNPDDARRSARLQLGGIESVKEKIRDVGWESMVESLLQDLRYGVRMFYGLNTIDGISIVGVSLLFVAIALVAVYPPSRRALRVDPIVALRNE